MLAKLFRERGLSIEKARDFLKEHGVAISSNYLGSIARGDREPSLRLARSIAEAFSIKPSDIIKL